MEERDRDLKELSDQELLRKAKDGQNVAFDIFYNRHKRRILNYIYRMTSNRERAEELAQEVFVKAYLALDKYLPEGKGLNWIYTIAGNLSKNYLRDKRHDPKLLLDKELRGLQGITMQDVIASKSDTPLEATLKKERELLIQDGIKQLPVKYREILILCDIQGHSYEETGEILKCTTGSVGSRLSKARSLLASKLEKYFSEDGKSKEMGGQDE